MPSIASRIDVMAGYSWQHFWERGSTIDTNIPNNLGFRMGLTEDSLRVFSDTRYETENFLVSFFGRMQYSFMGRYLITATIRNDGTSRFVGDNKWGLFPSAAFAWRIDQEDFMQNLEGVSELRMRLGWGITGQQDIGAGNYPALSRYIRNQQGAYYFFGDQRVPILRPEGYDENLKWEETTTYNFGIDYGFMNDRFTGSIDYYFRETKDLINFISIPAGSNLTNAILTNIGSLENQGIELSLTSRLISTTDMVWRLGFNATYSETKITQLTFADDEDYLGVLTGGISGGVGNTVQIHSVGFAPYSFFLFQQVYDENGKPIEGLYVDRNGDGQITDDDRYHFRKPAAEYFLGVNSSLEYRSWGFSFAGRASLGNFMYNNVSSMNGEFSRLFRPEVSYLSNITSDVFDFNADNNPIQNPGFNEVIFAVRFDGVHTQTFGGTTFIIKASIGGDMNTLDSGVDDGWGGLRTTKNIVNLFHENDQRAMFFTEGQALEIDNRSDFSNGIAVVKFTNLRRDGSRGSDLSHADTDFPMLRLADVYLMYAELHLRGGGGNLAQAVQYFNAVRERSFGNTSNNISEGGLTLARILDKRARELYWEGHRRTDLIRFGRFTGGTYLWPWKGNIRDGGATDDRFKLFPIPQSDLTANPNLEQNPGYN